jgi:hypothetical protein
LSDIDNDAFINSLDLGLAHPFESQKEIFAPFCVPFFSTPFPQNQSSTPSGGIGIRWRQNPA